MKISAKFARTGRSGRQRGVTMVLIAVGLSFMILAMAALAIDLVALYGAHNDAQLAADAAALAGAKAIADSGYTTDQGTIPWSTIQPIAASVATAVATQNKISGQTIPAGSVVVTPSTTIVTNPQVSVTITTNTLPAFFSRIWGNQSLSAGATSVAEAYNPSNPSGANPPVQSQCVKPWLLPNLELGGGLTPLFNPLSGVLTGTDTAGSSYTLSLSNKCTGGGGSTCTLPITPVGGQYIPAQLTAPVIVPSCNTDACDYEQNISSCSPQPVACGANFALQEVAIETASCGIPYNNMTNTGTSCLIHGTSLGSGQDCMGADAASCGVAAASPTPTTIFAGANNRLVGDGVNPGDLISTSDSLVTIPVFDSSAAQIVAPGNVTVIGFVQAFIKSVDGTGHINISLVNISGCSSSVAGSPVQGDSISPVPVHLISP